MVARPDIQVPINVKPTRPRRVNRQVDIPKPAPILVNINDDTDSSAVSDTDNEGYAEIDKILRHEGTKKRRFFVNFKKNKHGIQYIQEEKWSQESCLDGAVDTGYLL